MVILIAVRVFTVELALSEAPVAFDGSLNITVAFQPLPAKLDEESVARAKYCTANVVVVLILVAAQLLDAVNAVAR